MVYEMPVTGTHIWYFYICKREVWLMVHQIAPDQEHDDLDYGRFISEQRYNRNKKEISIGNIVVDHIRTENGRIIVGEVKKSTKFRRSAKMQLLFYLKTMKEMGIDAKGELLFPEEKKKEIIELNDGTLQELTHAVDEIRKIARLEVPPEPVKISMCKKCAYQEYCWAEG